VNLGLTRGLRSESKPPEPQPLPRRDYSGNNSTSSSYLEFPEYERQLEDLHVQVGKWLAELCTGVSAGRGTQDLNASFAGAPSALGSFTNITASRIYDPSDTRPGEGGGGGTAPLGGSGKKGPTSLQQHKLSIQLLQQQQQQQDQQLRGQPKPPSPPWVPPNVYESLYKRLLLKNIEHLCTFFGPEATINVLFVQLLTFLSDQVGLGMDYCLRFFESVIFVSSLFQAVVIVKSRH